jgi:7-carboxy-7-deazaguanine synthase
MSLPEEIKNLNLGEDEILINEYFYSLQGEGIYSGKAAFFIRFSGCDIGCIWCDSKEAWSLKTSKKVKIAEITDFIEKNVQSKVVVITGGEPFLYNLETLTKTLKKMGMEIHIETSGAYPKSGIFDWLSLSPKRTQLPLEEFYPLAKEMKIVIKDAPDLEFAKKQKDKVKEGCELLLQPEWESKEEILPEIIEFIKTNPEWQLSLQSHKYLGIQ